MVGEGLARDILIIFRRDRENDPSGFQREGGGLHIEMSLAGRITLTEQDSVEPVVPDHSAPERVVQIEHKGAFALASHRPDQPTDVVSVKRTEARIEGNLGNVPLSWVVPTSETDSFGESRRIQQEIAAGDRVFRQFPVHVIDEPSHCADGLQVETAEQELGRTRNGLKDTDRLSVAPKTLADPDNVLHRTREASLRSCKVSGQFPDWQAAIVETDENCIAMSSGFTRSMLELEITPSLKEERGDRLRPASIATSIRLERRPS